MENAKESATVYKASNIDILTQVNKLTEALNVIQGDIADIKRRVGYRDRPLGMPDTKNYNTDPGPWTKKPAAGASQ